MKLEAKSPLATLGKFMVDFNDAFPTLFLRFYKSSDFSIDNRFPHNTKLKDMCTLPLSIKFNSKDKISLVIEKLQKALSIENLEIVYYPKEGTGAFRFVGSDLTLSIDEVKKRSDKEGWLSEKEKKKLNLV